MFVSKCGCHNRLKAIDGILITELKNLTYFHVRLALLLVSLPVLASAVLAQDHFLDVIAEGTTWQTQYHVVDSKKPGPVVMIVGAVHGNEPAGARAANQIRDWKINRGKLIVLPRANIPALQKQTRHMPSLPRERDNLNRNFPRAEDGSPKCELSTAIWALVCVQRPHWLLDLHEGDDFTQINNKSVGSSIIAAQSTAVKKQAKRMLDALNITVEEPKKKFVLKAPPAKGSLARAAAELLGIKSMILETTRKHQPLSLRVRQHRIMVHRFLTDLQMVSNGVDVLVNPANTDGAIYVALYDAGGVGNNGPRAIEKDLSDLTDVVIRRVGVPEIHNGVLKQFDVLIIPGGSASKQAQALGDNGRAAIVNFVKSGGGYLGSCAGCYLASHNYTWSLRILDAKVIDRKHWKRGEGQVKIELTEKGKSLLRDGRRLIDIRYANGPLLARAEDPNIPDFEALAIYHTEIAMNGAPQGVMKGTPAIITGRFGQGRVFCSSPHPEYTDGLDLFVYQAIRWAAGQCATVKR